MHPYSYDRPNCRFVGPLTFHESLPPPLRALKKSTIPGISQACVGPMWTQAYLRNPTYRCLMPIFPKRDYFLCTGSLLWTGWGYAVLLSASRLLTMSDGFDRKFRWNSWRRPIEADLPSKLGTIYMRPCSGANAGLHPNHKHRWCQGGQGSGRSRQMSPLLKLGTPFPVL